MNTWNDDYLRIERSIQFLESRAPEQPSLDEMAEHAGLSPFHFQRLFTRWAGISPKRFAQLLSLQRAKQALNSRKESLLDAAFSAGLSGPGRLHDLFVTLEAVTPGEYKAGGAGVEITQGLGASPFGPVWLARTERGICHLSFIELDQIDAARAEVQVAWPKAKFKRDDKAALNWCDHIFSETHSAATPLALLCRGTPFQVKVWQALLRVKSGEVSTYELLAKEVCTERASRAVGGALAANTIGWLIPCHRVIRKTGVVGTYRWGDVRKKAMLVREQAQAKVCT